MCHPLVWRLCSTKYLVDGKDTHDYFGDGRFVVLTGHEEGDLAKKLVCNLYDQKTDDDLDTITNYVVKDQLVYAIGQKGYTKLNYETGIIIQGETSKFTDADKSIFKELEKKSLSN